MNTISIALEAGSKRVIASALEWPGWSRGARDEAAALEALRQYRTRYARVLAAQGIDFEQTYTPFSTMERVAGNSSTDFGVPNLILAFDRQPLRPGELERLGQILSACWQGFATGVDAAQGKPLRSGPRGGGRSLEKIVDHVLEAEMSYLKSLGVKADSLPAIAGIDRIRSTGQQVVDTFLREVPAGLPERGPRGGIHWPARTYARRSGWHILDHLWEIEDRIEN